jgi:uncharacterized protein YaeQ
MSQASTTLYRFRIDLSDIDRGVYETLDFRAAMHPSEGVPFLLTRVLAYTLNYREGIEFAPGGLSDPDGPCIRALSLTGEMLLWIEIGSPSARKLHRAAKAAKEVKIYTYKDSAALLNELSSIEIHRGSEVAIYSLPHTFLKLLGEFLARDNKWTVVYNDGNITVTSGNGSETCELQRHFLK